MAKKRSQKNSFEKDPLSTALYRVSVHKGKGPYTFRSQTHKGFTVVLMMVNKGESIEITSKVFNSIRIETNRCLFLYEPGSNLRYSYSKKDPYEFFEINLSLEFLKEFPLNISANWLSFNKQIIAGKASILEGSNLYYRGFIKELMHLLFLQRFSDSKFQSLYVSIKLKELLLHFISDSQLPQEESSTVPLKHYNFVVKAKELLEKYHKSSDFTTQSLAARVGTNETTLKYAFKKVTGTTLYSYFTEKRLATAQRLLSEGNSVSKVAELVGYSSIVAFSYRFKEQFGISPGKMKGNNVTAI